MICMEEDHFGFIQLKSLAVSEITPLLTHPLFPVVEAFNQEVRTQTGHKMKRSKEL